jgi:hypothetical protein
LELAIQSKDPAQLDQAIEKYESLNLNLNPKLVQEAINLRNDILKKRAAERSLKAALASKDIATLRAALAGK